MLKNILKLKEVVTLEKQQQKAIKGGYPFDPAYCRFNPYHPCCNGSLACQ